AKSPEKIIVESRNKSLEKIPLVVEKPREETPEKSVINKEPEVKSPEKIPIVIEAPKVKSPEKRPFVVTEEGKAAKPAEKLVIKEPEAKKEKLQKEEDDTIELHVQNDDEDDFANENNLRTEKNKKKETIKIRSSPVRKVIKQPSPPPQP